MSYDLNDAQPQMAPIGELIPDGTFAKVNEQVGANPENLEAVHALEAQYDAVVRGAESALPMAGDGPLPSGDEIAAQLEEFLREMDDTGKGQQPE